MMMNSNPTMATSTIQEEEEEECSSSIVESPPRFHVPQHKTLLAEDVMVENMGDARMSDRDLSTDPIDTPRKPVRFAPDTKQTSQGHDSPSRIHPISSPTKHGIQSHANSHKSTPLEDFFHHRREKVYYYRIIYRGVVALLAKPEGGSRKSGAYVSYGEIIASTKELYIHMPQSPIRTRNENVHPCTPDYSNHKDSTSPKSFASSKSNTAHSTSSLPLAPSQNFLPTNNNSQSASASSPSHIQSHNHNIERIVQVDEVLTGGYAIDASSAATSYTHHTPRRSNGCHRENNSSPYNNMAPSEPCASPAKSDIDSNTKDDGTSHEGGNASDNGSISGKGRRHHGFLCLHRNGIPIAESVPAPPLLCQAGRFYYRVTSLKPLPILAGPCADAPRTRAMALPGTVHEISLRMGSYGNVGGNHRGNSTMNGSGLGLQDGIVYLRLSHRRGWIADRRFVTTLKQGGVHWDGYHQQPQQSYEYHKPIIDKQGIVHNENVEVEIVAKEVSDYVDISSIQVCDDMSLGGTSISSASFATPASVIRTRRRPIRRQRRTDQALGMVVQHKSKSRRNKPGSGIGGGRQESSPPISDISMITDDVNPPTLRSLVGKHQDPRNGSVQRSKSSGNVNRNKTQVAHSEMQIRFSHEQDHEHANVAHARIKPDLYLMRVTATQGLKILDAPHFQVNRLIRGQGTGHVKSNTSTHQLSGRAGTRNKLDQYLHTKNPSSIFHTMNGNGSFQGGSDISSHSTVAGGGQGHASYSWELDVSGKYRILPRGALFEASKRMEKADNLHYAPPGSGLIKLADSTGWAIVPNRVELEEQLRVHQANGNASLPLGMTEEEALQGFEEVGNACAVMDGNGRTRSSRSRHSRHIQQGDEHILWVRVVQQTGVFVSCTPCLGDTVGDGTISSNPLSHSHCTDDNTPSRQQDHDAVSTVSSALFDAFRSSSRKPEARLDSLSVNGAGGNYRNGKNPIMKGSPSGPIIPCGACVRVKKWASSNFQRGNQSFVRLSGSQGGWIPRIIHGVTYSVDIRQPDLRRGSFWFRVQPVDGVKVRIGPSARSPAIKSESGYFQFECGEYLRASEILIIHGHADIEEKEGYKKIKVDHPSESFAKLYRNNNSLREEMASSKEGKNDFSTRKTSLDSLTTPGEWVHVHCNGHLYLEECVNPPSIERHPDGWRYEVSCLSGVDIRRGPSFSAKTTGSTLQYCASVLINEKVTASGEVLTWLRLKDGRGWVHNVGENAEVMMKSYSSKKDAKPSVNKLISRLGLR